MSFDTLLTIVLLMGAFAGAFLLFRSPSVYLAFFAEAARRVSPIIVAYVLKRNTPKVEEKMKQATRRAEEWDNFNKRPRDK